MTIVNKRGIELFLLLAGSVLVLFLSSCGNSTKQLVYFRDVSDTIRSTDARVPLHRYSDPKIQPNDLLHVAVQTLDPGAVSMMGVAGVSTYATGGTSGSAAVNGYMVDKNGFIELPLVGKIKVGGMTTMEAREVVRLRAAEFYQNPVVNVRIVSFEITLLGEFTRPGRYIVPNEKISILDAIGMAGDLNPFGKRRNVLLVREENGEKKFVRFDLQSSDIFKSPYFYLQQGDMVYVEPTKGKMAATDAIRARNISLVVSITSLVITAIFRFI